MSTVLPNFCSDSDSIQRLTKDTSLGHVLKRSSMYRLIKKKAKFLLALSILAVLQSSCSATRSFCQRPESGEVEDGFDCYPAPEENSNFQAAIKMSQERERTFIMIKPDGVQRGLVGKIIQRFEDKGFKLVAMKFVWPSEELLQKHYADLSARPFFPGLVKYMSSGPVVPMVWEGLEAVKTGRKLLGETNPADSLPGTIRGDLCVQVGRNIIHGSDAVDSAKKEIGLWFTEKELVGWTSAQEKWVYED